MLIVGGPIAAAFLFFTGVVAGRAWVLVLPIGLTCVEFAGLDAGWWGGGLIAGWEPIFAQATAAGVLVTALGLTVPRAIRRFLAPRLGARPRPLVWRSLVAGLFAVSAGAYAYERSRPADVSELRDAKAPLYYLGSSFDGLRLTHAEGRRGYALFVYGDCDIPVGFDAGGCHPPLQVQNRTCDRRRTVVSVFAHSDARARRAAEMLRPVDPIRTTRPARAAVQTGPLCGLP